MSNRTIVVGDTHGCADELSELLGVLRLTEGDRLISLGDLLDKGPDPVRVVSLFREAGAELVLGNHEEKLMRFLSHERRIADARAANPKQTPPSNPMKATGRLRDYLDTMSEENLDYLATARVYVDLPAFGAVVLHGGVEPSMEKLPPSTFAGLTGKEKDQVSRLLRTRHVSKDTGKMLTLGTATVQDPFWADIYDGRFGHVFFGHDPSDGQVRAFPHATGLDTGCVYGGRLTAVVLTEGQVPEFVSVPGRKYATRLYDEE